MKRLIAIIFAFSLIFNTFGQTDNIENWKRIIAKRNISDTTKLSAYINLAKYLMPNNPDSAYYLLTEAESFALKALGHIRKAGYKEKLTTQLAQIYYLQATIHLQKNNLGIALQLLHKSLQYYTKAKDTIHLAEIEAILGQTYLKTKQTAQAIKYLEQSQLHTDSLKEPSKYAKRLANLALAYQLKGDTAKAISLYVKSFDIAKHLDSQLSANIMQKLAQLTEIKGDTILALQYYKTGLEISQKLNLNQNITEILISIGKIYLNQGWLDSALTYFNLAKNYATTLPNPDNLLLTIDLLIAKALTEKGQLTEAEKLAQEVFSQAKKLNDTLLIIATSDLLKEINLLQGNCPRALRFLSIEQQWQKNLIASLQTKLQKANNNPSLTKIDSLSSKISELQSIRTQEAEKFKQTLTLGLIFISALLILILLLAIRHKKTLDQLNQLQNSPKTQRLLEELIAKQFPNNQQINFFLTQLKRDFTNASILIRNLLPKDTDFKKYLKDAFVLYIPKDEISGDFYWCQKYNDYLFVAVADTTGKGLSGILMSIMGINLLSDAINKQQILEPNKILDYVRTGIIQNLEQKEFSVEHEFINMSLIRLDLNTKQLMYAGAKQAIYIISPSPLDIPEQSLHKIKLHTINNITLYELKPDLMPLGLFVKMHDFETLVLNLVEGSKIYLFTDGFINQFGGEFDEKFGRKKFRNLIANISDKSMSEQRKILETEFFNWKQDKEQTDDITIVGLNI